jgi:hypothetical protein
MTPCMVQKKYVYIDASLAGGHVVCVKRWRSVTASCDLPRPKAILHVEFDEQFESEVRVTLASMAQEI